MEEKKFDPYQFIGFVLIAMILTWMLYQNQPQGEVQETNTTTQVEAAPLVKTAPVVNDSLAKVVLQNTYGDLAVFMQESTAETQILSSEKLRLEIEPKGGQLTKIQLKEFENYLYEPLNLVANGNSDFNIAIPLKDGRTLNTRDFYFIPTLFQKGEKEIITLTAGLDSGMQLQILLSLSPESYLVEYQIRTQGLAPYMKEEGLQLEWNSKAFRLSLIHISEPTRRS